MSAIKCAATEPTLFLLEAKVCTIPGYVGELSLSIRPTFSVSLIFGEIENCSDPKLWAGFLPLNSALSRHYNCFTKQELNCALLINLLVFIHLDYKFTTEC